MTSIEKPWEKKNQLLADFESKKITLDELQKECAYWYLDCFDEIRPKPLPTPPQELIDFRQMPFQRRMKVTNDFWFMPIIKNYLGTKEEIKNENHGSVYWLKEHLSHIPEEDFLSRSKFNQKIEEFAEENIS